MGPQQFVDAVSTQAAKIFNLYPRKGLIAPGSDADVIVFDPAAEHTISAATHHSAMDTNVYEGMRVRGRVCRAPLRFNAFVGNASPWARTHTVAAAG